MVEILCALFWRHNDAISRGVGVRAKFAGAGGRVIPILVCARVGDACDPTILDVTMTLAISRCPRSSEILQRDAKSKAFSRGKPQTLMNYVLTPHPLTSNPPANPPTGTKSGISRKF